MLFMLAYPHRFSDIQATFGREYTSLSRINKHVLMQVYNNYKHLVINNVNWYRDRFDMYAEAIEEAISQSDFNPVPGTIPANLVDILGFVDCTIQAICRITVSFMSIY